MKQVIIFSKIKYEEYHTCWNGEEYSSDNLEAYSFEVYVLIPFILIISIII